MENYLDMEGVAKFTGLTVASIRTYRGRANQNRRLAEKLKDPTKIREGDLPEPDNTIAGSPVWLEETISEWQRTRSHHASKEVQQARKRTTLVDPK